MLDSNYGMRIISSRLRNLSRLFFPWQHVLGVWLIWFQGHLFYRLFQLPTYGFSLNLLQIKYSMNDKTIIST